MDKISGLHHLDKPTVTEHPLAGQTFDYLGFQTQQAVINEMHGDNRIAFSHEGKTITFGQNMYSWDLEELAAMLLDLTGRNFGYDAENEEAFEPE